MVAFQGDGSLLPASTRRAANSSTQESDNPSAITEWVEVSAVERLALREGWVVARDCRGLIVRRHVAADVAVEVRRKLNEIVLD